MFYEKVCQNCDTFVNYEIMKPKVCKPLDRSVFFLKTCVKTLIHLLIWEICQTKMGHTRDTFKQVILKVKTTSGFLKVACRKCDTLVTDFRKLKDSFSKIITFKRGNTIWSRRSLTFLALLTTRILGCYKVYSHMKASRSSQTYKDIRD